MALTGGNLHLDYTHDGAVARITLENGRYNIVTMETRRLMAERFEEIGRNKDARLVVITAKGQHFTSGGDIAGFMEVDPIDLTDLGQDITAPARSPLPVIAAIDGYCFGVGFELALSCDIRLATVRTEFALPEMRLGMIPGSGGTQRLGRLIGLSRAKYHVLTGERISADQALSWGITSATHPDREALDAAVEGLVTKMLGYSSVALRTAKEVLDRGIDAPLYSGIELERKAYAMLRSTHDFAEGVAAFGEKRSPRFEGR